MFVLKNVWTTMMRHKARTIFVMLVSLIVSAGSLFGLSARYSYESAIGPIYQSLSPQARVAVDRQKVLSSSANKDASQIDWNTYNFSWKQWTTYAEALDSASIQFTPMYDETAKVAAVDGQIQPVDGSTLTVTGFYDSDSSKHGPLGSYTVVDGADLKTDDADQSNALIPKALADKNGTKVGDTITVAMSSDTSKTITLTVTGIYTNDGAAGDPAFGNTLDPNNAIYVSYYTFGSLGLSPTDEDNNTNPVNIVFKLNSLADFSTFESTLRKAGLSDDYTISAPNVDDYNRDIIPLRQLGEKLTPALIALWSVCGVLAALLIVWTLARRGEEIGYDIAMGVSRPRIGWQFALELILPAFVGVLAGYLAAGFGTGPIVAKLTTEVHGTPLSSLIWQCIWAALGAFVVLAIITWIRVACYRTTTLFAARTHPDTVDAATPDATDTDNAAKEN